MVGRRSQSLACPTLRYRPRSSREGDATISKIRAALPVFNHLHQTFFVLERAPDRLAPFQRDFVHSLALTLGFTAKMGGRSNPQHTVQRNVLIVDAAKN